MAIRVTDKDGKTIKYEVFLVDRMVDMTKVTQVEPIDDETNVMFYTITDDGDGEALTAHHWEVPKDARDKIHALATKWLAINEGKAIE